MIRQVLICGWRIVLLAGLAQASLAGCAAGDPKPFPKLELARLKQQDWWPWKDKGSAASQKDADDVAAGRQDTSAVPPAPVPAVAPVPARAASNTGAAPGSALVPPARSTVRPPPPSMQSWGSPRARPARGVALVKPVAAEPVTKAPQGKVVQEELPQIATAAPGVIPKSVASTRYSVEDLMGLNGPAVERLLGKPDLSRQEPFAEVWQYTHGDCVLFLFLYPSQKGGAEVAHAETGARDGGKDPDPRQCVSALAARNTAAPG